MVVGTDQMLGLELLVDHGLQLLNGRLRVDRAKMNLKLGREWLELQSVVICIRVG